MDNKKFDLNIEKVLENWDIQHAIREIIANALDEQILTNSSEIEIFKKDSSWHIKDYGRGIKYTHLTQNESIEKIEHIGLIGKFGVGLKDALATFDRYGTNVKIISKYGIITIARSEKYGFEDIRTLHAIIEENKNKDFVGTEFVLTNCTEKHINQAKNMFIKYKNLPILEATKYGEIYDTDGTSNIYINGMYVSSEDNFLFSYNITSLTKDIKDALNRERTNVGRNAYQDRVIDILLNTKNDIVIDKLIHNLGLFDKGDMKDELNFTNVCEYAVKLLNRDRSYVFVTPAELSSSAYVSDIVTSAKNPIFIPENIKDRISNSTDIDGNPIETIETVLQDYNKSFTYDYITYKVLTKEEQKVYDYLPKILKLIKAGYFRYNIFISETIAPEKYGDVCGCYNVLTGDIVIRRDQLSSLDKFAGTVIHEVIHAKYDLLDITRGFEISLTEHLGIITKKLLEDKSKKSIFSKLFNHKNINN